MNDLVSRLNVTKSRAFLVWLARVAFDLNEEDAIEATSIDGSNDKGIDLFYIDQEEGKVIVVQGKYSDNGAYRAKINSDLSTLQSSLNWLASPEALRKEGKPDLASAADEYPSAIRDGYGVELWYAYCGPKCANVERSIAVFNQNPENIEARRSCRNCDIALLQTYFEQSTGDVTRLTEGKIKLIPKTHFEYRAKFGVALVATVSAAELVRLYKTYEDRLFDRNVRLFLGAKKGSINAEIAETLKGESRVNFWAYNNGLTFVCSDFQRRGDSVKLNNFCIVNGCQSTRSLVDNESSLSPSVTVLVRVLAAGKHVVDDVIRYTNSQNPIRAWDLASQHKTQRRLKRDFDSLTKPYIYITRRGDTPTENLDKYKNGKIRQIKLADVAQYLAALVGKPVMAYKNKAFIFSTHHDDVFPHDIKAEEVLFASICGDIVKEVVAERRTSGSAEEQRILLKGGHIFTMAALGHVAQLRNGATYLKTLDEEQITSNAARDRFRKYASYAVEAYLGGVADAIENSSDELTTAIRQPPFFEKIKDRIGRQFRKEKVAGERWFEKVLPKLA